MITDVIVFSALVFAAVFGLAWAWRPDLRAWIERPKYRFQETVQSYDHSRLNDPGSHIGGSR